MTAVKRFANSIPNFSPGILILLSILTCGSGFPGILFAQSRTPSLQWYARFGLGYESVSQGFYVQTADTTDEIGIATLERSTLDDIKGAATLGFKWQKLLFETGIDQTPELWRLRLHSEYSGHSSLGSIRLQGTLDRRSRYRGSRNVGDNYWLGTFRGRTELALGEQNDIWLSSRVETVDYDSTAGFTQSASILAIRTGFTHQFGLLSSLSIGPFYQSRGVPDSSTLQYQSFGAEATVLHLDQRSEIDAILHIEDRRYQREDQTGDFLLIDGTFRHKVHLGGSMLQGSRTESELYRYRSMDQSNPDFWHLETRQMLGFAVGRCEILAGPYIGWLTQEEDTLSEREDYFESGVATNFDLVANPGGAAALECVIAYRNLSYPTDFQSNFWSTRVTLVGDQRVMENLSVNLFLTTEWEWHQDSTENSQINLISGGVSYRL